jgi:allantoinase
VGAASAAGRGPSFDLVVRAGRAIVDGAERAVEIGVADGRIVAIEPLGARFVGVEVAELAPDEVLLPGLVDSHVHLCDPGNTEWEDFEHATRAAAAGGITTLVDMPIDSLPPTTTVAGLEAKRRAAEGRLHVDIAFWGGLIPGNRRELRPMLAAGARGFKCFLADTGDPDFPGISPSELEAGLAELADADRDAPLLVHAESAEAAAALTVPAGRVYADYLRAKPRGVENLAIAQVIEAARRTGGRAHIVHLSSADALSMIASARRDGVRLTVETCPHYLALSAEEVPEGATAFKCSPPIREAENRERLWEGLRAGLIDQVVSDHSPSTPRMKEVETGDFATAWGGISSLQLTLPVVWTEASRRGFGLPDVVRWMAERPAELARLGPKGAIRTGADADLTVLAPDEDVLVDPSRLHHRNKLTPYAGRRLRGRVRRAWLRGVATDAGRPRGREVPSPAAEPSA